ncbi:MAG: hypothetical protein GY829_03460 [Gammaproteobacteria bacterium]|nr:hypothetical protein [Gammaproteobacteria bacterium]
MNNNQSILVYRRTHTGDPDDRGIFGINDCMKSVRDWSYDAVIGIGGIAPWREDIDIAKKVNWIGINPTSHDPNFYGRDALGGKWITFEKFLLLDGSGPLVEDCAPKLYKYMFEQGHIPRTGKYFPKEIYEELLMLLHLANDASSSKNPSFCFGVKQGGAICRKTKKSSRGCS